MILYHGTNIFFSGNLGRCMTNEQRFLIQSITERMVGCVMRDRNLPMIEAFRAMYQSPQYELLCVTETGLYTQSPLYVYSYFK